MGIGVSMINAISTFIQSVFSGSTEPGLTHAWLIGLCVLGSLAVAFGIILESWPPRSLREIVATILVIGGVIFEGAFTVVLFVFDEAISHRQEATIESQRSEIIALENRLAARSLSDTQASSIVGRLRSFAPLSFQIIPYWEDKESHDIAERIARILGTMDWKLENPTRFTMLAGVIAGVVVNVDGRASDNARNAAKELASALTDNGVDAIEKEHVDTTTNPASERIDMQVGIKP